MPAKRQPGMDHPHYEWSPIHTRTPLRWPGDHTVALCLLVSLNHMEWEPPAGSFQAHNLAGGLGRRPALGQRDRRDGVGFERCEGHGRGGEALRGTPPRRGFQRRRGERYESYDDSTHFCA